MGFHSSYGFLFSYSYRFRQGEVEGARPALVDAVNAFLIEQRQALRASRAAADAASAASHLGTTLASAASGRGPH